MVGQEKEPPNQGLLSESTQSLITLSSLGRDTQPISTALNQACAFPAQRCHRKRCHSGCFTRKTRGISVCVCLSGRRKDRRCERTTDTSSSLPRLHQIQHKNSLFCKLQTEQNPTFGTKFRVSALKKKLTSCFDFDFIFTLISNILKMKVLSDSIFWGIYFMYSYKCIKNLNKNVSIF